MSEELTQGHAKNLGLTRWVQVVFMVLGLFLLWLLDKVVTLTWELFAEPNPTVVTLVCVLIAGGVVVWLYRHEKVNRWSFEVVGELSKVTWPSQRETSTSTVIVIVTSIIAALILGAFDAAWSTITDLIYKV